MNSFIPWVGGKSKLLWIINKMAPDHYSRFIDVFGGSGTVTMSRPIQPGCMEVYNDFNSNLTNLFCCVKNRPLALLAELGFLPLNTRDDFNVLYKFLSKGEITDDYLQEEMELTEILLKPPEAEAIRTLLLERAPRGDVRRAADFFKLVRYSFSGSSKSFGGKPCDMMPCICPPSELEVDKSLGSIFAAQHISVNLIKHNLTTLKRLPHLTMLGLRKKENEYPITCALFLFDFFWQERTKYSKKEKKTTGVLREIQ